MQIKEEKIEISPYLKQIEAQTQKFEAYYNFLVEYNQKVNLTAITVKEEVKIKHFLDSILSVNEIPTNASVIDVGAGAGFPSLPLKIVRSDINLTMLDSLNKRITFLNELTQKLNLTTTNIHARAEEFAHKNPEKFDIALARAVARTNTLVEYLLPLTKVGGKVILYKGSNYKEELIEAQNAIKTLGGTLQKVQLFTLPNNMGERAIIIITKTAHTPPQYPRLANQPKLKPIK